MLPVCVCVCADYASSGSQCQWDNEEMILLERFFEAKVCGCLYCSQPTTVALFSSTLTACSNGQIDVLELVLELVA